MNVIDWLLDCRPRDPLAGHAGPDRRAGRRGRPPSGPVSPRGLGRALLALQAPDGSWGGGAYFPDLDRPRCRPAAAARVRPRPDDRRVRSRDRARPRDTSDGSTTASPSSRARSSRASTAGPWRSGRTSARTSQGIVDRLLTEQMADGGWNCEQENGSIARIVRHDDQRAGGAARVRAGHRRQRRRWPPPASAAGIPPRAAPAPAPVDRRGHRAQHGCLAPLRIPDWLALRRAAWARLPARRRSALRTTASPRRSTSSNRRRAADGRWAREITYHDQLLVDFGEPEDEPSRWITLRAIRVLRWAGREDRSPAQTAAAK